MVRWAEVHRFVRSVLLFSFLLLSLAVRPCDALAADSIVSSDVALTVIGRNKQPKPYIRVEISGPENRRIATDRNGMVSTRLAVGTYMVVLKERSRQKRFELVVEPNQTTEKTFKLPW